ncbi:PREDICTED: protein shuttle craft [Ceratosolen solmsi marchali]|uniref:Protein shuttle craft n=1 Tax=Ceratosolen solmsi marchali TaxID=326594 RepID=A0AAJ6YDP2_9HYME|nr:PREDICTED: protein shuttle craft [Ceratosolen solmsi marchali]
MATWDGSYSEPDGPNYYVNSNKNQIPVNVPTWDYLSNINNTCAQDKTIPYVLNTSMVFESNIPSFYNSVNRNNIPFLSSNIKPENLETRNEIQTCDNKVHVESSETHFKNNNDQLPNFYENNKSVDQQLYYYNKSKFYNSRNKYVNRDYKVTDIVQHSNLHATANEFLPNYNKKNKESNTNSSKNETIQTSTLNQTKNVDQSFNIFFENNRERYNDKKFDKGDANKMWRDKQNNQNYKYNKKHNIKKYQNDKCTHRKFYDKTRNNQYRNNNETTTFETNANSEEDKLLKEFQDKYIGSNIYILPFEADNLQYTKNSKIFSNNGGRYDKKIRYNSKNSRNFRDTRDSIDLNHMYSRDRKNNYLKFSGCNQNNYKKDKYERRETKNLFGENRNTEVTDWRQKANNVENKSASLKHIYYKKYELDDASQRERLTEQLNRGQLECLVCCDFIRQIDYVWSCKNCYHVLHLKCLQKWALSSQDESGWRCPACQKVTLGVPSYYECFCGKIQMPNWNRHDTAHSCGEMCGRIHSDLNCVHKCTLLCHPGACPPCSAMVTKSCGCGKMSQIQKCSTGLLLKCNDTCDKPLNCGIHKCENKCHHGNCEPCDKIIKQECFCLKCSREEKCVLNLPSTYSCQNICNKILDCNNHNCKEFCHPGECRSCVLKPEAITNCCCGETILTIKRANCLEPIPTCDKICGKQLKCGQPSKAHTCQSNCHQGECPECELFTKVKCRCGYMDKEIPCKELITKADDARCKKKCTKKRSCGKHKCNQMCCIDIEHICPLSCLKYLSCGRHKCEQTCHGGRCLTCWRVSFDELYCECGTAVIYPPVACGTRRPACNKPCSRSHSCDHEVLHNCHSDLNCPPCTVLTQKWCYGQHELRKAVPCYVNEVSCGLPCGKSISCGKHKCIQICHPGICEKLGYTCIQPCMNPREICNHICAAPCHKGKCPDVPCKETVKVTCQCGNRTMSRLCAENAKDYQRIASKILASKMADMQLGHSIDLEEVFGQGLKKQNQLKTLECNDECKIIERNRRLTLGLQIENPDLCGKLMPRYSEHMRQWAKRDSVFCQMVHDKLTELVQLAKASKQKSRSYSFESMNRDKRHFVHELCAHFGCESQAYDQEPKRNIVATAVKDKCWLPSYSLMELLQRENGQRKVPGPMLNKSKINIIDRSNNILQLNSKKSLKSLSIISVSPSMSPEPEIDYFNYKG